jgi:hypothetical protein
VAGGALMGVVYAFLQVSPGIKAAMDKLSVEHAINSSMGQQAYYWIGIVCFALMGWFLYKLGVSKRKPEEEIHT